MINPFRKINKAKVAGNKGTVPARSVKFTVSVPGALGLTTQPTVVSEDLSDINAARFEALYDSYKEKLYDAWKLYGTSNSFDKWLAKQWDQSRNRFRM